MRQNAEHKDWKMFLIREHEDRISPEPMSLVFRLDDIDQEVMTGETLDIVDISGEEDLTPGAIAALTNGAPLELRFECAPGAPEDLRKRARRIVDDAIDQARDRIA